MQQWHVLINDQHLLTNPLINEDEESHHSLVTKAKNKCYQFSCDELQIISLINPKTHLKIQESKYAREDYLQDGAGINTVIIQFSGQ